MTIQRTWTYFDESMVHDGANYVSCLGALVIPETLLMRLHRRMYAIQKRYFGKDAARDGLKEFKGSKLLSRQIEKKITGDFIPKNWLAATEVIGELRAMETAVYLAALSYSNRADLMVGTNLRKLTDPMRRLLENISKCCADKFPNWGLRSNRA